MSKEYKTGYKKPPQHTQFKPGTSGNPKGRPKGIKNFLTDLENELSQTVLVTEGSKQIHISKQQALIKRLIQTSLNGNVQALNSAIKQIEKLEEKNSAIAKSEVISSDGDVTLSKDQLDKVDMDKILEGLGV